MMEKLRASPLARLLGTSLLVLILQIPIGLISSTIDERRTTRAQAMNEVTGTWGGAQEIAGPILTVPQVERWVDKDNTPHERITLQRFLPRTLQISGEVRTQERRRGIFEVPLYESKLQLTATFALPEQRQASWKDASISLGISDPKAIKSSSGIEWQPGADSGLPFESGLHAPLPQAHAGALSFSFELGVAGSSRITFVPSGDETTVTLKSNWPDPSFDGAWLPSGSSVSAQGFESQWHVLDLARNFPSRWEDAQLAAPRFHQSEFGVTFLSPVDTYRLNDRAVKYQLLFLGLTFVCFALVEILGALRVHPIQYLLVGLALCLFYLLLLSLSEQIGFARAYGVAAVDTVVLVSMYIKSVLRRGLHALLIGSMLSGLYGFLFVLLQIQDYALLVGSGGLFVALAGVMWLTRKIDWYALGAPARAP